MTRRMIDSAIWANEHFASLPPMARLLEIGIINMADDQGRMKANPAYVRSQVFPYEDVATGQIIDWLTLMAANGTVKLYEIGGKAYLQLVNWWEYQALEWARPSEYAAPAGWKDRIRYNGKGGIHLSFNWMKRTGEPMTDTCDCKGSPLGATPSAPPATPAPPTDLPPAPPLDEVHTQVDTQVHTLDSNADKLGSNKDQTKEGEHAPAHACVTETPEFPPPSVELPPHLKNLLAQANGHPRDYRRREKADADEYTDEARQLGIAPAQFTDRINRLASVLGKRSLLDAAPNDDRTLNEIKGGALTLARLGYHTEADYRQLAESFAQSNQWMDRPIPTLKQFVDHAAAVKDGVLGKDAKTRPRLPKPGPGGFYDFPTMAAMKDAVGQNPDLRSRVTVKGTKV